MRKLLLASISVKKDGVNETRHHLVIVTGADFESDYYLSSYKEPIGEEVGFHQSIFLERHIAGVKVMDWIAKNPEIGEVINWSVNDTIEGGEQEKSMRKSILTAASSHGLAELFAELKLGRKADDQDYLDQCIKGLSNPDNMILDWGKIEGALDKSREWYYGLVGIEDRGVAFCGYGATQEAAISDFYATHVSKK